MSGRRFLLLPALLLLLAACGPESDRTRGGGPGADIGNRPASSAAIQIHGKTNPAYKTPLTGRAIKVIRR